MKKLILALGLVVAFIAAPLLSKAQTSVQTMYNASASATETVTNTGTGILTSAIVRGNASQVTIQVAITETSGTTAGTLTLQGSLDGTNFYTLTNATSVPQVTTFTALDVASQTFIWRLDANPCAYYRVSWTGSGTMIDTFTGKILTR
jgi:hypothetical protein